jgi:hypothetical protein
MQLDPPQRAGLRLERPDHDGPGQRVSLVLGHVDRDELEPGNRMRRVRSQPEPPVKLEHGHPERLVPRRDRAEGQAEGVGIKAAVEIDRPAHVVGGAVGKAAIGEPEGLLRRRQRGHPSLRQLRGAAHVGLPIGVCGLKLVAGPSQVLQAFCAE